MINWILSQCNGSYAFYNDTAPSAPYAMLPDQARGDFDALDYAVLSYEDRFLPVFKSPRIYPNGKGRLPKVGQSINILLMRDPFNLLASRYKSSLVSERKTSHFTALGSAQLYLSYAREYVGSSAFLGADAVPVSYNEWFYDKAYRQKLASQLSLPYSERGMNRVAHHGGGSSFQGTSCAASELQVFSRWAAFRDDPVFQSLFRNPDIVSFGLDHFYCAEQLRSWAKTLYTRGTAWRRMRDLAVIRCLAPAAFFFRDLPGARFAYHNILKRDTAIRHANDQAVFG